MTQEEFDKAPLLDQILYDTTGMLVENHRSIAEAMEKYHQAKLKLLGIANVVGQSEQLLPKPCKICKAEIRNDVGDGLCAECWSGQ
jgi:hypothetical protein